MIIIKQSKIPLLIDDLLQNVDVDFNNNIVNISYSDPKNGPYDPIGFIETKDGEDIVDLKSYIDFLNNEKLAALIWIGIKDNNPANIPVHITPYLCCAYEGKFEFLKNKQGKTTTMEQVLLDVNKVLDISQSPSKVMEALFEKAIGFDDLMVFMDNRGNFSSIRDINFYKSQDIKYGHLRQRSKPHTPIKITNNVPQSTNSVPAFSWENYEDLD